MRNVTVLITLIITLPFSLRLSAQPEQIVSYFQTDGRYDYRTELLQLAIGLNNDNTDLAPIKLQALNNLPHQRGQRWLKSGKLRGVVSLATNKQREQDFLAIRIPIMAGILGMRVFLISSDQQHLFNPISTLEQLQQIPLGFVQHWGDIEVLRHNKLTVVPATRYETVFPMLTAGRFRYFPRGVNEVFPELKRFRQQYPTLKIESNNAFFYSYPVYFFVHKNDHELAGRLEDGLNKALTNGSFKALFVKHHAELMEQLKFDQRNIFILDNPTLPAGTPVPDTQWWTNTSLKPQ